MCSLVNIGPTIGLQLIPALAKQRTDEFGCGSDKRNLFMMRRFYLTFPMVNAVCSPSTWSHYRLLTRINDETAFRHCERGRAMLCTAISGSAYRRVGPFYISSMIIQDYIAQHLRQKLTQSPTLLVYDDTARYHEIVNSLAAANTVVIDAGQSFILAREAAQQHFTQVLPTDETARLVIYLPYLTPVDNQARIQDPYFMFGLGGATFPYGPADRYGELCKACYPGQESKIDALFPDGNPSFETVDALGDGNTYALLQTLTGGKSGNEILPKL